MILVALLCVYYRFLFHNRREGFFHLIVGLLSGLAVWCLESSLILIFTFLLFWFHRDGKFFLSAGFWRMTGMFLIGAFPLIYDNIAHSFLNIKHLSPGAPMGWASRTLWERIWLTFSHDLPSLFHWDIVHNYPQEIPWYAWSGYIIAAIASVYVACILFKPLGKWIGGWKGSDAAKMVKPQSEMLLFAVVYMLLFQVIFTFSKFSLMSPRYLLTLMPGVFLFLALFAHGLLKSGSIFLKAAGIAIVVLWGYMGLYNTFTVSRNYTVIDGFVESQGPEMEELVNALKERNIDRAYAEKFTKYRVIFYSAEEIIVSRFRSVRGGVVGLPSISLYPRYEQMVEMDAAAAYIFGDQPEIRRGFEEFLAAGSVEYEKHTVGSYAFYYRFNPYFSTGEFLNYLIDRGFNPNELQRSL